MGARGIGLDARWGGRFVPISDWAAPDGGWPALRLPLGEGFLDFRPDLVRVEVLRFQDFQL